MSRGLAHSHSVSGIFSATHNFTIKVYPSNVDIHFADGCITTIDVGVFYMMFAAHLYQNGLWADIDWTKVPDGVKQHFEGHSLPQGDGYSSGGGIYAIKRTYISDVPLHTGIKPVKGIRAVRRRRMRMPRVRRGDTVDPR